MSRFCRLAWFAVAVSLAQSCGFSVARAELAAPSPDEIYTMAQRTWTAHVPPPHVTYTIAITVTENATVKTRHYRAAADTLDGTVTAAAISDEERASEPKATGTRIVAGVRSHGAFFKKQLGAKDLDFLGVPLLAPDYSFGVARRRVRAYADPDAEPVQATSAAGQQIGRVTTTSRRYRIALAGIESLDEHAAYHLTLVPLAEPTRFRLRDLWVDTTTTEVLQLRTAGNFDSPFTRAVPWLVTFRGEGDARYIDREIAETPFAFGEKRKYDSVEIRFGSIAQTRIAPVTLGAEVVTPGLTMLREP